MSYRRAELMGKRQSSRHVWGSDSSSMGLVSAFSPVAMRVASQSHHLTSVSAGDEEQFAGASLHRMEILEFGRGVLVGLEAVSGAMGE